MSAPDLATPRWVKSSYSANNGDCVEIAWVKSSYSTNNGDCVEVALVPGRIAARDSKAPEGGALTFSTTAFGSFLRVIAERAPE